MLGDYNGVNVPRSRVQSSPRVSWTRKARAAAFRAVQNGPRPPATGSPPRRLPSPEPQPRRARAGGAGAALADSRRSGAAPPPSATAVQECDPYRSGFVPRNPAAQFGRAPPPSIGLRRQHGGGSALGDRGRREMRGCSGFCGECGEGTRVWLGWFPLNLKVTVTGLTTSLTRDGVPQLRKGKQNIMLFACSPFRS
ncbi:uncharacterized protein LOC120655851 [Panicum virgatum]|uniref:uncharacterized protein LOC120655851 n=1 Tax=Panicum virgatum TaxID=38727 RepID=UPI0019D5F2C1|nr:uncharacterized protein LOC120655851 [Panicum virgatum]